MEQFCSCLSRDIEPYIAGRGVKTVKEAAQLADIWEVIHHGGVGRGHHDRGPDRRRFGANPKNEVKRSGGDSAGPLGGADGGKPAQSGAKPGAGGPRFADRPVRGGHGGTSGHPDPICHRCNKPGHIRPHCPALRGKADRERVVALVSARTPGPEVVTLVQGELVTEPLIRGPFVSPRSVAVACDSPQVPIQILRDTGASQSLLVARVLGLPPPPPGDPVVLLAGLGGEFGPYPL